MTDTNISIPHQNRTRRSKKRLPRSDVDDYCINLRLFELQELLGTYCYGIPMSRLSWLERVYLQKFNESLDCKSLGVNHIKELVEMMRDKGMVLLIEEPESKNVHVMSAHMVKVRQNDSLKPNVQTLLDRNSGLINFISFEDLYERQFNVKLNYFQYGLTNLDHLCKVLKDILMVEEADPPGAKVIKAKKRKYYSKKKKCLPRLDVDVLIDQRLVELEELLGNYCYGIPVSCLSWLERVYLQKFNKSLDYKSLGVNDITEVVEKMHDKGMVLFFEEPESKKVHVLSARMVKARQDVSLKPNVQTLLESNSGVIEFTSFEDLYKRQFQVKLNYFQYGLTNLDHLCDVLNDILMVKEAHPPGAKLIMWVNKKRKYTNMSMLSSPQQNQNICDQIEIKEDQKKAMHSKKDVDVLIDQTLVELEALLRTYEDGIPMSNLSPLYSLYKERFNKSLDCISLGVNDIKELVEKMRDKGMVVLVKGSEGKHVMPACMVKIRQNVFLKLNVQKLLRRRFGEIEFESFESKYEERYKVKLNYLWYGLTDLDDLCKVLKDILVVEEANPSRVKVIKAVKNATIQGKGRMTCAPQSVHSSYTTNRNMSTQSSDFYQEIQEVLGDFYLGISLSHWSMFEYCYKQKFNKSLKSLGVTDFTQLLRVMGERVVSFVEREWEEEYVMSAPVANFRREFCLKPDVEKLLYTCGGEIEFDSFENSYEDLFKDELFFGYYGLTDLDHLCQIFENILVVEEKGKKVIKAVKGMYNLRKKKK